MTPIDAFLVTLAIGSGLALTVLIGLLAFVTATAWEGLLAAATAAFHRYAVRDMVITAYYDDAQMSHVRKFELPEPYLVKMTKKGVAK